MRILGLDVGDKRIGIAISDEMGITAQGLTTLKRTKTQEDMKQLIQLVQEKEVEKIVVGLPRNMNGTYGPQSDKVKEFMNRLPETLEAKVVYWDERLTTVAAQRALIEGDLSRKKRKLVVDKIAAVMILQSYLDLCSRNKN